MARGRSGVISKEYKGEDNTAYHDVIKLFKIYRVVNWQMQIKISQVKRRFHMEYGTDVDEFLDTIYQAGMDVERDLASEKDRVEAISRSNQYLRLIDEAVDLMRRYHPQGERYYWVLYYSYLSSTKLENVEEILDKLEPHFPQYTRIHRTTYFRWREQVYWNWALSLRKDYEKAGSRNQDRVGAWKRDEGISGTGKEEDGSILERVRKKQSRSLHAPLFGVFCRLQD